MLFRAGFVRFCFNLQLRPYGGQGGNKPATESKKDNQAQTGKKKTIVAEKSKEARAESKKINIESEFAFILWEKGAVKFCLPSCREKTELFVLV